MVTDGSNLYPAVLAELWPAADHQLCAFHILKEINQLILDAVRRLRTAMSRRGRSGRKKRRGRKSRKASTDNGGINIDGVNQNRRSRDITTQLGSGGAPIRVRTTNGGVRLTRK